MKIGYISFRLGGNDGVSLEAYRWKTILERMGHTVAMVDGEYAMGELQVPRLHFLLPEIKQTHDQLIVYGKPFSEVEPMIFEQAEMIEEDLRIVIERQKFDQLIVANNFSLPMNLSSAIALDKLIREFKLPTIARNHDFWWERSRFLKPDCKAFFEKYFVPNNEYIKHVTINSITQKKFADLGYDSVVIPDTFDFESGLDKKDEYSSNWRQDFGIGDDEIVFLQATRIIPRKRIEWAMEMVQKLDNPKVVFVVAGRAADEGKEYLERLMDVASGLSIRCVFIGDYVDEVRGLIGGKRIYTLWDCFVNSDWMTYTSDFEGFGNQFIEGVYFKKPVFVNRYDVYKSDIEPLGFECVSMDGVVSDESVNEVNTWMANPKRIQIAIEKNYEIAKMNYSYEATETKLRKLGF